MKIRTGNQIGRTAHLLEGAPKGATILSPSEPLAERIRQQRSDLDVRVLVTPGNPAMSSPLLAEVLREAAVAIRRGDAPDLLVGGSTPEEKP